MNRKQTIHGRAVCGVALTLLMAFALMAPPAHAVKFSDKEKSLLKAGKTIVKELPTSGKKGFYGGSGYAVINAPVDVVWKSLIDWQSYTEMFPNTEVCHPVSKKGDRTLLQMKIGHPVVNVEYYVEMTADESKHTLAFDLVSNYPHDVDSIKGYWRLFPQKNGRTLAAYVVAVQAPMGIVAIAGKDLAKRAIRALLNIPGDVKRWVEGPNGVKYK